MLESDLWAGALNLLMRHELSGCSHAARQAAGLLDRIAEQPDVDRETRTLCERMSERLARRGEGAGS